MVVAVIRAGGVGGIRGGSLNWLWPIAVAGMVGVASTLVVCLAAIPEVRFSRPGPQQALQLGDKVFAGHSFQRRFVQYDIMYAVHTEIPEDAMQEWQKVPRFRNWMRYRTASELQRVQVAAGFPFRCAACAYDTTGRVFGGRAIGSMQNPSFAFRRTSSGTNVAFGNTSVYFNNPSSVLCLTPLPAGIAANVSFYALAFLLIGRVWRALVRRTRFRKGRCPNCGYDLAGNSHTRCPECGEGTTPVGGLVETRSGSLVC